MKVAGLQGTGYKLQVEGRGKRLSSLSFGADATTLVFQGRAWKLERIKEDRKLKTADCPPRADPPLAERQKIEARG